MLWLLCSINPARSFGPALAGHHWHGQWVFWVGPYAGALVAALVYELVFREPPKKEVPGYSPLLHVFQSINPDGPQ